MATKTVVCQECGTPVVPGRYACAECGSLLAAVSVHGRGVASDPDPEPEVASGAPAADGLVAPVEAPSANTPAGLAVGALSPDLAGDPAAADSVVVLPGEEWDEPVADASAESELVVAEPEAQRGADSTNVAAAVEPDVLDGWEPHEGARTDPAWADQPSSAVDPDPAGFDDPVEPALPPLGAPPVLSPSAWPPAGDRGVLPAPAPRAPAGAYLPPSAVLDALDPASATGTAGAPAAPSTATSSPGRSAPGANVRGLLDSVDMGADAPRAVIAVGAAIAAIGFLLPWANVLAGAGLLGGYFTQWGLAGPGHWIALTLLVATVGVALAGPPTARWPVGLGAIALAALLVGMMWPYLFGFLGRSIGIWVVLAGAIVLIVGGVLDRLDRHDPDGPPVP